MPQSSAPLRILVTGATGQVGDKLLGTLAPLGEVMATDSPHAAAGTSYASLDLTDQAAVVQLLRNFRPHVIVNPAAYTAVDKAETESALATAVNVDAPRLLAEQAKALSALLIHYSTDYVFDGSGNKRRTETDKTAPLNVYGATKLAGEDAVRASGCAHVILRTSWVFSDHGQNFVKTMLRLGAEREELRVVADQIGAPTSASFLARMTARIVAETARPGGSASTATSGVYHLTCAGETSWHGFAVEIFRQARAFGRQLKVSKVEPIPSSAYPTPARRPLNSRLDSSKALATFGGTQTTWDEALRDVMAALCRP